jgi:hypothetical protein
MLKEAGFTKVEVKTLPHDFQNYYYISHTNWVIIIHNIVNSFIV